jgi:hypothetical protein
MRIDRICGMGLICLLIAVAMGPPSAAWANESTALCEEHVEAGCGGFVTYTGHLEAQSSKIEFKTTLGGVKCTSSTLLGNALGLAHPQITHLELLDFTGCKDTTFGTNCKVEKTRLGLLELLKVGLNSGVVTAINTEISIECATLGINCKYEWPSVMTATGSGLEPSTLATFEGFAALLTVTAGAFCPSETRWSGAYKIVLPDEIFILR